MGNKTLTLGEVIRTVRRRASMSQSKLAKLIGVHFSSISRWERGQETEEMAIKYLKRIGKATKTPVTDLLLMSEGGPDAA